MLESFINPWTMAAGAALVSAPIIIHLMNRIKPKRVRWAAMEFLLKSQKRNRRKLIIEQLILLMLRCLLVALAGMILARFLGFSPDDKSEAKPALHVVVLDDTPSMGDFWKAGEQTTDSFGVAKRTVVETIAAAAAQATAAQELQVVRMSDLGATPRRFERLSLTAIEELRTYLADQKPSPLHVPLVKGLQRAQAVFNERADVAHVLHLVGDFRATDWSASTEAEIRELFTKLAEANVEVHLHDVAYPERKEASKAPLFGENVGIVDLRAETRVVAKNAPVEFVVDVANYSNSDRKNVRITVRRNGTELPDAATDIPNLPANQVTSARFVTQFDRTGTADAPLDRFNLVSATIEGREESGIAIDNVRYVVAEVRDRVPVLIIEGSSSVAGRDVPDGYYVRQVFDNLRGYDVVSRPPAELERGNLRQYSSIYVVNVARLTDKAARNLSEYVATGGGVGFFLGEDSKPDFYNSLYANGEGIFPVPLQLKSAKGLLDEYATRTDQDAYRVRVFPRDRSHPALERIYNDGKVREAESNTFDKLLARIRVEEYWQADRLKRKRGPGAAQEILTFSNVQPVASFEDEVQKLLKRLPTDDKKIEKFAKSLTDHAAKIRAIAASSDSSLIALSNAIGTMLEDRGSPTDREKPNLQEFWQAPEQDSLREDFVAFQERTRYGDPLYVIQQHKAGRVAAFLTTGNKWMPFDFYTGVSFIPVVMEMQKYLASSGTDQNLTVGTPLEMSFDALAYTPKVNRWSLTEETAKIDDRAAATPTKLEKLGEQTMDAKGPQLSMRFDEGRKPGAYLFEFTQQRAPTSPGESATTASEFKAFAFNVDTANEGNLRRIDTEELKKMTPGAALHIAGDDLSGELSRKKPDWSESPWIYLAFMLILVAEQAMAVHLSFHARANEAPVTGLARPATV